MVVILALLGLTNTGLPIALITWGEQFIDSGIAAILNSTVPFFSLVIAHFFLSDEHITINKLIGLVVGFIGVVILLGRDIGSVDFKASLVGQLAVLGAAVLYAGSAVYVRRNLKGITPTVQAFQITLMGDLWVWIGAFSLETPAFPTLTATWIAALWLGLLGTFVAYLIYFNLIQNVGATRATMVTYLLPVFGVALGAIFLREQITLWVILGMALVIAGIYVVNSGVQVLPVRLQEAEEAGG
jgi:drug/metabolite transporter (DMT)-like permease